MKKIISVIVFVALLFSVSVVLSCGDSGANTGNGPDNPAGNSGTGDVPGEDTGGEFTDVPEEESFDPGLPEADFEGYNFRILNIHPDDMWWAIVDADIEEQDGEVVNDAIYMRNRIIEDRYKFEIEETNMNRSALANAMRRSVTAGADDYDVALPYSQDLPGLINNNTLLNLKRVDHLNFDKPWWNTDVSHYFSIDNKLLFAMSDLLLTDNDDVVITMYNRDLAANLGLDGVEPLYRLVEEGKWTMDKFTQLTRDASADLTGSGIIDYGEDRFGLTAVSWLQLAMIGGFNEFFVSKDENDIPYLSCNTERFQKAYQTMTEFLNRREWVALDGRENIGSTEVVFASDRALMCIQVLSCVRLYREMESDFGILPMPKLDEEQEKYSSYMVGSTCITIPKTNPNPARTGLILEALSAESRRLVIPAYYEVALGSKYLRDEGSVKMLDIILDNRVYDILEVIYGWGSFSTDVYNLSVRGDLNFASLLESREGRVTAAIEKTLEAYAEVE
ncbi:MAG: hypothetical protein FWH10_08110 [Oscillospiraceae bacterium]|nr:hypothetical protein [Oscillospiraceae bacterium]